MIIENVNECCVSKKNGCLAERCIHRFGCLLHQNRGRRFNPSIREPDVENADHIICLDHEIRPLGKGGE